METQTRYTVVGAGVHGRAMARHLALIGIALEVSTAWKALASSAQGSPPTKAVHNHPGYWLEHVPVSLVPMAQLAQQYCIAAPGIHAMVNLAPASFGEDCWSTRRMFERLAAQSVTTQDLRAYVMEGWPCGQEGVNHV